MGAVSRERCAGSRAVLGRKIAYLNSTGADEPPTWAVLSFGAMSGSIGATSVYREGQGTPHHNPS